MPATKTPTPTEIKLHQQSRLLELRFDDGSHFELPCEYLRVFSRAAEVQVMDKPVSGKQLVNIKAIDPQGSYAIRIHFDDGHDTGIYSWETLYDLGSNQDTNWSHYLAELEKHGLQRAPVRNTAADGTAQIDLLYFIDIAKLAGKDGEQLTLPADVTNVSQLLDWLKLRGKEWRKAMEPHRVTVTVNKQFAHSDTIIEQGDEVALVSKAAGQDRTEP